jgi:hypothetical protein
MTKVLLVEDNEMNRDMLPRRMNEEKVTRLLLPSMVRRGYKWRLPNDRPRFS